MENYDLAGRFQKAFEFFNQRLFADKLPCVVITTQRHRGANGYFAPDSYVQRHFDEDGDMLLPEYKVHEIAIMPDSMYNRTDRDVLSTLVHEMCHLKQQEYGSPSRHGYHNREWAEMMRMCGLQPTTLGRLDVRNPDLPAEEKQKDEGKETGQKVSHYIIPGGAFDEVCKELLAGGFTLNLQMLPQLVEKAKRNKLKYTCPQCGINAWAKQGIKLACGECMEKMECEEEDPDNDEQ